MPERMGYEGALYYNPSADALGAAAGWIEIKGVQDVDTGQNYNAADMSSRNMRGETAERPGMHNKVVTFQLIWDPSDTSFGIIRGYYSGRTKFRFQALDGLRTVPGSQGPSFPAVITKFDRTEGQSGIMVANVEVRQSYSTIAPEYYVQA